MRYPVSRNKSFAECLIHEISLDQDLNPLSAFRFHMLKRKFLDSFAFLCATKKDGDSVSAACMEEGLPQGTIIRIASNAGVRENTLCQLRQVLDSLNSVSQAQVSYPPSHGYA